MKKITWVYILCFLLLGGCASSRTAGPSFAPSLSPAPAPSFTPSLSPAPVTPFTPTPSPAPIQEAETILPPSEAPLSVFADPITGFFASADFLKTDTLGVSYRCALLAQAWEAEVEHAHELLQKCAQPIIKEELDQMKKDYLSFVDAQAIAEAFYYYTDAFGNEGGGDAEHIGRGTGYNGGYSMTRAELLEKYAKDLYGRIPWPAVESSLDRYIFDPADILAILDESKTACMVGEYALDAAVGDKEAGYPENPIDPWVLEHLYQNGTTSAMVEDAVLETEIWRAELLNAYDRLIAAATANDPAPKEALEQARDAMLEFAPVYGNYIGLSGFSDAFDPDSWKDHPEDLTAGTLARVEAAGMPSQCYRQLAFRLWEMLGDAEGEAPHCVFKPEEYEGRYALPYQPEE